MKSKLQQIVTAAEILRQMPTRNPFELRIKKGAVAEMFTAINAAAAEMDSLGLKKSPDYLLKGTHLGSDGREKSFTFASDGEESYTVYIRVVNTVEDVSIYIEANFDSPSDKPKTPASPVKILD